MKAYKNKIRGIIKINSETERKTQEREKQGKVKTQVDLKKRELNTRE